MGMRLQDFQLVGRSATAAEFEANLVYFAHQMDFGLISAGLIHGDFESPDMVARSVGNTPAAFLEIYRSLDQTRADPVMKHVMKSSVPFTYDQRLYVDAGEGEMWEAQAPYGYCTGIAVGLHLGHKNHFLIGVDRPRRLPKGEDRLTRMLADFQLLAVHAQYAAQRIFGDEVAPELEPDLHLTSRELECLKWTMEGKSAYVTGKLLAVSPSTVNFHLQNAMKKLKVASKHQAVLRCVALGIL